MQESEYLFVYGTLLKKANHMMSSYLEQNATFQGKGYIHGRLYEVMHYPGAVLSQSPDEKIRGEYHLLHDAQEALLELDEYEECVKGFPEPFEFKRERVQIYTKNQKQPVKGWAYLYNLETEGLEKIASGDYEQFLKERRFD